MKSILIVNNNEYLLAKLTAIFKNTDYHILATTNSLEVVGLFNKYKPFAVIVDIYMRDKDGFEITREIRAICQKVFILVISVNIKYLNTITCLGADLALPISTHPEFIVNAVAVAEKSQVYSNSAGLLPRKSQGNKKLLKIA